MAEALKASRVVRAALVTDRENTPLLTEMGSRLSTNRSLEEEIFSAILSEDEISDHASQDLYDIRRHIRQINDRVRDKLNSLIRSSSMQKYLQDAIITMRNDRYVVPVKAECRQFVPGTGTRSVRQRLHAVHRAHGRGGGGQRTETVERQGEAGNSANSLGFSARVAPDAGLIARNLELLSEYRLHLRQGHAGPGDEGRAARKSTGKAG